jgi:hypothetical protein
LVEVAHEVLNREPLAKGPQSQMGGANLHYANLLRGEAERQEALERAAKREKYKMQAVAEDLHLLNPEVFIAGLDVLTASYIELDPKVHQTIEADIRAAGGVIDAAMQIQFEWLAGGGFGAFIPSLDLHDIDLSGVGRLQALVDTFPQLLKLNVAGCHLSAPHMLLIRNQLTGLQELDVSRNPALLQHGMNWGNLPFPNLRVLNWNGAGVTARDIERLPQLPALTHLSICASGVWGGDIFFLQRLFERMPNLTHLDLSNSPRLIFANLRNIQQMLPHLQELTVKNCRGLNRGDVGVLQSQNSRLRIID